MTDKAILDVRVHCEIGMLFVQVKPASSEVWRNIFCSKNAEEVYDFYNDIKVENEVKNG